MEQGNFNFPIAEMEEIDPLRKDWEAAEDRASAIWKMPLRKQVVLRLKNIRGEFKGVIHLARRPKVWDAKQKLELRMEKTHFTNHEIESCTQVD